MATSAWKSFRRIFLLAVVLVFSTISKAQIPAKSNIHWFDFDDQGSCFIITEDQELIKYDSNGTWVANYRDRVLGRISKVDISNPLQLLVFYPETATIVKLDNNLYPVSTYSIPILLELQNPLLCRSFDNLLWYYNDREKKVVKTSIENIPSVDGQWLGNRLPSEFKPVDMEEINKELYLLDSNGTVLSIDLFGNIIKIRSIPSKQLISYRSELCLLTDAGLKSWKTLELVLPLNEARVITMLRVRQQSLFGLKRGKIELIQPLR
jgi:hypothetical protein